jgi:two-component system cell cycle response regulator
MGGSRARPCWFHEVPECTPCSTRRSIAAKIRVLVCETFDVSAHDSDSELPDAVTAIHDFGEIRSRLSSSKPVRDSHLLVRMNGAFVGQVLKLEGTTCTVGRAPGSSLWLRDDGVSRDHARIEQDGEGYQVIDCGSANGTYVEGLQIERQRLADGDIIQLGPNVLFRYSQTDADHERMLSALYDASVRDPLTGAYNREHFEEHLRAEVSFALRHRTEVALLMLDLDHFKAVNDTYGHPAGDQVLIDVVWAITSCVRLEDILVRYGGEEFVVVVRDIGLAGAYRMGERVRETIIQLAIKVDRGVIRPTASFGCATLACCPEPSAAALIATVDRRLYEAKRRGRNCVVAEG